MRTNTEMRAINPPPPSSTARAPTEPLTLRPTTGPQPTPTAGHRRMAAFLGAWQSDGRSRPSPYDPVAPTATSPLPVRMHGSHVGEWLPGEFFLINRWDQRVGNVGFRGLWVMGYDSKTDRYFLHLFDDAGNSVGYRATVEGQVWTIVGDRQRATFRFSDDGATMTQQWSMRDGDAWVPLCDVRAIRAGS